MIDAGSTFRPEPDKYPEELWGIEDPRITFVGELGKYAVADTAFSRGGPGVALALTQDFRMFERYGLVMQPDDKDAPVATPYQRQLRAAPSPCDRLGRARLDVLLA